ncbi:DinB family protein [Pedobacter heparinus]|uniref:DinB family protein n=1 Tax=Pedobacter heparinus TaxID=984 RepID=UPI002930E399|nr:DinB family protein [Pedobacter heparinus]
MNGFKEQIIYQMNEFYSGDPWVTENFEHKVATMDADTALKRIPDFNHTIAEIVEHMAAWRYFAVRKLKGDTEFDIIDNTNSDWPEVDSWEFTLNNFHQSQCSLIEALNNFQDEKWTTIVPQREYNFRYLLNGVLQHDYYHYGQIGCLIAAQEKNTLNVPV